MNVVAMPRPYHPIDVDRSIDRKDRRLKVKVEGYFFLRWSFIMKEESFLLKYILTITSAAVAETGEGYNFSSI